MAKKQMLEGKFSGEKWGEVLKSEKACVLLATNTA